MKTSENKGAKRGFERCEVPKTMKALVAHGPLDFRLETVPTPVAGEGETVIKVEACGICAGDLKSYHGVPSFWGGEGNPPYIKAPMIPGHEFIGIVVELGANAVKIASMETKTFASEIASSQSRLYPVGTINSQQQEDIGWMNATMYMDFSTTLTAEWRSI